MVKCPACSGDSLFIGSSRLNQQKLHDFKGHMLEGWLYVSRDEYGYVEQSVYCCTGCGMIFINPILSDEQTMALLFKACGLSSEWSTGWKGVEFGGEPSIWSRGIRVPSLNDTIHRYVHKPVRVLDVGAHGGEISVHIDVPAGSSIDLLQIEDSALVRANYKKNVRQFNGLLKDLPGTGYKADVVLALHVLEHTDNPVKFCEDAKTILTDDGVFIIEVPYELDVAYRTASDQIFELPHHWFFTPWSLKKLVERAGLDVLECNLLDNFHTGVGDCPYPVIRLVCARGRGLTPNLNGQKCNNFAQTIDKLFNNFAGSLAYNGGARFKVFVYWPQNLALAGVLKDAPGYRGIVTSNDKLGHEHAFRADYRDIDFIFTTNVQDRQGLRQNLKAPCPIT